MSLWDLFWFNWRIRKLERERRSEIVDLMISVERLAALQRAENL